MRADEHHRPLEKRPAQLPAVQQQLSFEKLRNLDHAFGKIMHRTRDFGNQDWTRPHQIYLARRNNSCFSPLTWTITDFSRISRQITDTFVWPIRTLPRSRGAKVAPLISAKRRLAEPEMPLSVRVSGAGRRGAE